MRTSTTIVAGTFAGAELEPGTFHFLALSGKSRGVSERVTDAANGHAHAQIGRSAPTEIAARAWAPIPDDEDVPGARM